MKKRDKIENGLKMFFGSSFRSARIRSIGEGKFEADIRYEDGMRPSDITVELGILMPELAAVTLDRQFSLPAKAAIFDRMYYDTDAEAARPDGELWEIIDRVADSMDFSADS